MSVIRCSTVADRYAQTVPWDGTVAGFARLVGSTFAVRGKEGFGVVPASMDEGEGNTERTKGKVGRWRQGHLVLGAQWVGLDFDEGVPTDWAERLAEALPWQRVVWTTHSHTRPGKGNRLRAVVVLSEAVDRKRYREIAVWLQARCAEHGLTADAACKDATRVFYTLRAQADDAEEAPTVVLSSGEALDPDDVPRPAPLAPRPARAEYKGEGDDVIDRFCREYHPRDVLAESGEYEAVGSRMRREGSADGAGVVFVDCDERPGAVVAISHHATGTLEPQRPYDSFEALSVLMHGGDRKEALRDAAGRLGVDIDNLSHLPPPIEGEIVVIPPTPTQPTGAPPAKAADIEREELARRLEAVGPVCADFLGHARATAIYWQPAYAVAGAIALGSVLGARRVVWPGRAPMTSSMFLLVIGGSGQGKTTAKGTIRELLASWPELIGPDTIGPSAVANFDQIKLQSDKNLGQVWLIDEYHDALKNLLGVKASAHSAQTKGFLLEMATLNTGSYTRRASRQDAQSGNPTETLHVPGLTLLGLSATEPLLHTLGHAGVHDGFVPRHLAFGSQSVLPRKQRQPGAHTLGPARDAVRGAAAVHKAWASHLGLSLAPSPSQFVPADVSAADPVVCDFGDEVDQLRRQGDVIDPVWARAEEHAMRVALSISCLEQGGQRDIVVSAEVARLACDIVMRGIADLTDAYRRNVHDSDFERLCARLLEAIEGAARSGDGSVTARDIGRRLKMRKADRDAAIAALELGGQIVRVREGKSDVIRLGVPMG